MKNKKGFTLLELLICVALISVVILFLFRLISLIRQDEKAVGYIRANQASRNQVVGELGTIIARDSVCSYSTTGSTSTHAIITFNLCTDKTLVLEVEKDYIKMNYDGTLSKYPMKDNKAWYNPVFTIVENNYYGYDYHRIVFKTEKKGMDPSPIDDVEIFWVDHNGFAEDTVSKHAQVLTGQEFSKKIRRLANPYSSCPDSNMFNWDNNFDCLDTNITKIERSSVLSINPTEDNLISTDTSDVPIFAWYSNGSIKIYSEAPILTMNPDSSYMFGGLSSLTNVDLSMFDSSQVLNMKCMFQYDKSLVTLDLSSLDTHNVRNMQQMIDMPGNAAPNPYSSSLQRIIFGPDFDTSNVTTMRYMMTNNVSLVSVDLTRFDTSNVTDFTGMLATAQKLETIDLSSFEFSSGAVTSSMLLATPSVKKFVTPKSIASGVTLTTPNDGKMTSGSGVLSTLTSTTPVTTTLYGDFYPSLQNQFQDSTDVNGSTGVPRTGYADYMVTHTLPVTPGSTLYSNYTVRGVYEYDSTGAYLRRTTTSSTTHNIHSDAYYIRIEVYKPEISGNHDFTWWKNNLIVYYK